MDNVTRRRRSTHSTTSGFVGRGQLKNNQRSVVSHPWDGSERVAPGRRVGIILCAAQQLDVVRLAVSLVDVAHLLARHQARAWKPPLGALAVAHLPVCCQDRILPSPHWA